MPLDYFAELFHRPLDRDLVLPWYDAGRFLAAPLANANGFALDAGLSSGRGAMGPDTSRATGAATTWATDHAAAEEGDYGRRPADSGSSPAPMLSDFAGPGWSFLSCYSLDSNFKCNTESATPRAP